MIHTFVRHAKHFFLWPTLRLRTRCSVKKRFSAIFELALVLCHHPDCYLSFFSSNLSFLTINFSASAVQWSGSDCDQLESENWRRRSSVAVFWNVKTSNRTFDLPTVACPVCTCWQLNRLIAIGRTFFSVGFKFENQLKIFFTCRFLFAKTIFF